MGITGGRGDNHINIMNRYCKVLALRDTMYAVDQKFFGLSLNFLIVLIMDFSINATSFSYFAGLLVNAWSHLRSRCHNLAFD